jgi:hypothetical protein
MKKTRSPKFRGTVPLIKIPFAYRSACFFFHGSVHLLIIEPFLAGAAMGRTRFVLAVLVLVEATLSPMEDAGAKAKTTSGLVRSKTSLLSHFAHFFKTVTNTLLFVLISCENKLMFINFQKNQNNNSIFKRFVQIFFFVKILHDFLFGY